MSHKRTQLRTLYVRPIVENNRVVILTDDKKFYRSIAVGQYCDLYGKTGAFDPTNYVLLETPSYSCIVDAKSSEKRRLYKESDFVCLVEQPQPLKPTVDISLLKYGTKVHLHSRQGMYELRHIDTRDMTANITCKKWYMEWVVGSRKTTYITVPLADIKCLAGGLHNLYR